LEKKVINKHRAIIQMSSSINSHQRKAFNSLLYIAREQLEKNYFLTHFSSSVSELSKMITPKKVNALYLRKK